MTCNNSNKLSIAIVEAGGITTILSSMKTHSSNADLQHYGCALLKNVAMNDNSRVKIAEAGVR